MKNSVLPCRQSNSVRLQSGGFVWYLYLSIFIVGSVGIHLPIASFQKLKSWQRSNLKSLLKSLKDKTRLDLAGLRIDVAFCTYRWNKSRPISTTSFVSSKVHFCGLLRESILQIFVRWSVSFAHIKLSFPMAIWEYKFQRPFLSVFISKRFLSSTSILEMQFIMLACLWTYLNKWHFLKWKEAFRSVQILACVSLFSNWK